MPVFLRKETNVEKVKASYFQSISVKLYKDYIVQLYGKRNARGLISIARKYKMKIEQPFPPVEQREIGSSVYKVSNCKELVALNRTESKFLCFTTTQSFRSTIRRKTCHW